MGGPFFDLRTIVFRLKPVPPFRLDLSVWALRRRDVNIVDRFDGRVYRRILMLEGEPVEVKLEQSGDPDTPQIIVSATSSRAASRSIEIRSMLERTLGMQIDMRSFYDKARDVGGVLADLVVRFRGVKPPRFPSVFEALANAVACQQISLSAGMHVLNRLAQRYGTKVPVKGSEEEEEGGGDRFAFPEVERLATLRTDDLRRLGFSSTKSRVLTAIARGVTERSLDLDHLESMSDTDAVQYLDEIPGIGRWSAEYVLLRGLGRTNIFPGDDVGARNKLAKQAGLRGKLDHGEVNRVLSDWAPFQGLLYFHLLLSQLESDGFVHS